MSAPAHASPIAPDRTPDRAPGCARAAGWPLPTAPGTGAAPEAVGARSMLGGIQAWPAPQGASAEPAPEGAWARWLRWRADRWRLREMEPRLLRDVGLTPGAVRRGVPFRDPPPLAGAFRPSSGAPSDRGTGGGGG